MRERDVRTDGKASDRDLERLRALRSDAGAFESLYREFYPRLYEFVYRVLGHSGDVEETINDTMMVVWNKSDAFAERSKVSTWIFGIAYKKALKRLKLRRRLAEREQAGNADVEDPSDQGDILDSRMALDRIRAAVGRLPLAQRSIVHLAFFYGYTYPEIAEIVGCPVNTVKTRMFYARERLRPVLDRVMAREHVDGKP